MALRPPQFRKSEDAATRSRVVPRTAAPQRIKEVSFSTFGPHDIRRISHVQVSRSDHDEGGRYGVMDSRMGVCNKTQNCRTCGLDVWQCQGHFGHVELAAPVFHNGFFKHVLTILRAICKCCAKVLLTDEEKQKKLKLMRNPHLNLSKRQRTLRDIVEAATKVVRCPHCSFINGRVKKEYATLTGPRLVHERYGDKLRSTTGQSHKVAERERLMDEMSLALDANDETLRPFFQEHKRIVDDLPANIVRDLLDRIPLDDREILDLDRNTSPANFLSTTLLVPPVIIRPQVDRGMSGGLPADDDVTRTMRKIVSESRDLQADMEKGENPQKIIKSWEQLQQHYALYLDADMPGYPRTLVDRQQRRCFAQRLKGKFGRFRRHLSGKRADFSGRTVISPDPNLRITEVAIPVAIAKILTYPERVHQFSKARLKKAVIAGAHSYPGANLVKLRNGRWYELSVVPEAERKRIAERLGPCDIVERHMINGDCVVFNRQPSLHRLSMMCHRARVLPFRTFRFNECCCAPYNADFDGDEMNIFLPQTEEARAECATLMATANNIISARHGEPIIAATQDFLTGAHLITRKDCFFTRAQAGQALAHMHEDGVLFELPPPAVLKPQELWTGKQIMSGLIRPNPRVPVLLNFSTASKSYTRPKSGDPFECEKDGYVIFRNSEMISGVLDKAILGGGSKHGLFYQLFLAAGSSYCARCMWRLSRLTSRWLMNYGFSIGISDVTPSAQLQISRNEQVRAGTEDTEQLIERYTTGQLQGEAGLSAEDALELKINARLAEVRTKCGSKCMRELHRDNAAVVMSTSGSKGNPVNISQMAATLGQVTVFGKRIANGFIRRALPHFQQDSRLPACRGFVPNSFYTGLSPHEFFFHTMGGREGLVDTAVKTADTGYMQRRLTKAMEDLCVQYDNKVADSAGTVVQLRYGDDGIDPLHTETQDFRPVALDILWSRVEEEHRNVRALVGVPTAEEVKEAEGRLKAAGFAITVEDTGSKMAAVTAAARELYATGEDTTADRLRWDLAILCAAPLTPQEIEAYVEKRLLDPEIAGSQDPGAGSKSFAFSQRFVEELRTFWKAKAKEFQGLVDSFAPRFATGGEQEEDGGGEGALDLGAWIRRQRAHKRKVQNAFTTACGVTCITRVAIDQMLGECITKHQKKAIQPGTTCGTLAAQSICEPATQMTLRTFHSAGAAVSITQGVPRLKEVVNAMKKIKTPIITAHLSNEDDERAARVVKARVERTHLGDILESITERYTPRNVHLVLRLDLAAIERRSLDGVNADSVIKSILIHTASLSRSRTQKIPLTASHIVRESDDTLQVFPYEDNKEKLLHTLKHVKMWLPSVPVGGIPTVKRTMIKPFEVQGKTKYSLLIEGQGEDPNELLQILAVPGVDAKRTTTNHVWMVEKTFGIEAARSLIISEIESIMGAYDARIDTRHTMQLADVMTFRGCVLGITRHGMLRMWDSVLTHASFEQTTEVLFEAAVHRRTDKQMGTSQQIIFGAPMKAGTGLFRLLRKVERESPGLRRRETPLFYKSGGVSVFS
eukprot:Hpha_TRINITY_DN14278_c0_g5::TRINITY_DN14278_c0_g5_i1::g.22711::m.22711/K03018/RPC1, POLR3A; DNA-directed RNA polymerase III subunit RPC1